MRRALCSFSEFLVRNRTAIRDALQYGRPLNGFSAIRLPHPAMEISTTSGVLRVIVHPAKSWLIILLELVGLAVVATFIHNSWAQAPNVLRGTMVFALASGTAGLIFQFSGTEIIEIDTNRISLAKDVHGWERKREYELKECRELEWMEGSEGRSQGLQFKIGWRTITFGKDLTENQAIQILTALQQTLPSAAQQLCSYPGGKEHFITLGLS